MLEGLELVQTLGKRGYYWLLDYRYKDKESGIYLCSKTYKTDREAIWALVKNKIKWDDKFYTKD